MIKRLCFFLASLVVVSVCQGVDSAPAVLVLGNGISCIRISQWNENFAEQFRGEAPTNSTGGIILDLRFADGGGNPVAGAAKFLSSWKSPVMVLVNGQTRGAAAGLAARLQTTGTGLVIGSTNATGEFHLDIAVPTSAADDLIFQANPYAVTTAKTPAPVVATNALLSFVDHMSEADLVRRKIKDGDSDDAGPVVRAEPARPMIHDPALARAVDLLKALAILRPARS